MKSITKPANKPNLKAIKQMTMQHNGDPDDGVVTMTNGGGDEVIMMMA